MFSVGLETRSVHRQQSDRVCPTATKHAPIKWGPWMDKSVHSKLSVFNAHLFVLSHQHDTTDDETLKATPARCYLQDLMCGEEAIYITGKPIRRVYQAMMILIMRTVSSPRRSKRSLRTFKFIQGSYFPVIQHRNFCHCLKSSGLTPTAAVAAQLQQETT